MDLFFVSQALKYTTATTQLLTDMADNIPKFITESGGVGPEEISVVCIEPARAPPKAGQPPFEACVLYDTTCDQHQLGTPKTTEEKAQAEKCNEDLTTCKQCRENSALPL